MVPSPSSPPPPPSSALQSAAVSAELSCSHSDMDLNPSPPKAFTRVDDLWFSQDSPIVIRAESKVFQVSKGILAARSTVFRDMIAFPQPASGDLAEQIDGIPVVCLHDSAQDVEVFLRAIYDSSYFMPAPASTEISVVLGILRLSHKYDVQYLYRRALDHLFVGGYYTRTYRESLTGSHLIFPDPESPSDALSIIMTAVEVGALWLLPYTYYCAATYSAQELLPFVTGKMGQHALKSLAAHAHLVRGTITMHRFLTQRQPCKTTQSCDQSRDLALSELHNIVYETWVNPFSHVDDILVDLEAQGMCDECLKFAKVEQHEGASAFWNELPGLFSLQPWEELRAMKRTTMGEDEDIEKSDSD